MTVDRPHPWYADLPELDERGRQIVLDVLLDVLTYRSATRDDVRDAYEIAGSAADAIKARLNAYAGDNIWQDVIYDLLTAEEWGEAVDHSVGDDRFIHSGVEYRYDLSTARWVSAPHD